MFYYFSLYYVFQQKLLLALVQEGGDFSAWNFNEFDFKIEKIDGKEVPYFIEPTFSGNEISNEPFLDRSFEFKFDDYYIYIY